MKTGAGYRPLLKSEIEDAQSRARSAREASRILGVSYPTYKKYARMYGILENLKNPTGLGIPRFHDNVATKYTLKRILAGEFPDYPAWKLRRRLIKYGYKQEQCEMCGFSERRITDNQMPLIMAFKDGNKKNLLYENLEILCYNCYFLYIGEVLSPNQIRSIEDNQTVLAKPHTWDLDDDQLDNMRALGLIE